MALRTGKPPHARPAAEARLRTHRAGLLLASRLGVLVYALPCSSRPECRGRHLRIDRPESGYPLSFASCGGIVPYQQYPPGLI